jgi:hypothetical protein
MSDPGEREAGKAVFKQATLESRDDYQVTGHRPPCDV